MSNNQNERTEHDSHDSKGGSGFHAGALDIFSKDNAKYFKPLLGAALGATNMADGKSDIDFDTYGFLSGMGTVFAVGIGAERAPLGAGLRPSLMLAGLGIAGANKLIDSTLFKGVDRKAPSMIADGVSMAIAFTPQPLPLKAVEMVGLHTAGRVIDKLLD